MIPPSAAAPDGQSVKGAAVGGEHLHWEHLETTEHLPPDPRTLPGHTPTASGGDMLSRQYLHLLAAADDTTWQHQQAIDAATAKGPADVSSPR
jgi:hypothetical protein